jgi:hypothetical protein
MSLFLVLASLAGAPDLNRLGADSFEVREAEERRCACPLLAVQLPARDDDPEIDFRVKRVRRASLRLLSAEYVERAAMRGDFGAWVKACLATGRTSLHPRDLFDAIHADRAKAYAVFAVLPPHDGNTAFLCGAVCPGEYERWLDFLEYHWCRPVPREVPSERDE